MVLLVAVLVFLVAALVLFVAELVWRGRNREQQEQRKRSAVLACAWCFAPFGWAACLVVG